MISKKLLSAVEIALDAHKGQVRKFSGKPYISHPFRVLNRIKRYGISDEDILVAAVGHDTIEDTKITYAKLKEVFNKDVADMVKWLSNPVGGDKAAHIKKIFAQAPEGVVIIKTFDRIDNLSDGGSKKFFDKYKETSDIVRDGLKKRGFTKLYNEYMKTYDRVYGDHVGPFTK